MSFLEKPLTVLKMGQRQHEAILAPLGTQVGEVMKKHDWTCHKCGVRMVEYMQVDHTAGHGNSDPANLRPICVFCHDQDHIIWAAARRRVIPFMAPDLTNEQISRLAWAMLTLKSTNDTDAAQALLNMRRAIEKRHHDFAGRYGSDDADSVIEATFLFLRPQDGESQGHVARKQEIINEMLGNLRFFPRAAFSDSLEEVSEGVSTWGIGGFSAPGRLPQQVLVMPAPVPALIDAVINVMSEE